MQEDAHPPSAHPLLLSRGDVDALPLRKRTLEPTICDSFARTTSALMADYLPEGGSERELDLVNVAPHVTDAFPPAYIMTCDGDFLHDAAEPLAKLLRKLGVMHELHIYGGIGEQLGHVFHCNMKSEEARRCNDDECRFFKRFL